MFKRWSACCIVFCGLILSGTVLLFGAMSPAMAQRAEIIINKPTFERIPIAVPNFKYLSSEQPQLAREMAEMLSSDLDFSGMFRPLDPKGFLEDPQAMGLTAGEIKFPDWKRLGADFMVRAAYQVQGGSVRIEARLFDVVSGKMVFGKVYEGDTRNARHMTHRLADDILFALTGERGVFDTKIAFVQAQGGVKEIFVADFDGGNPVQVTHDRSIALSPAWSSDGRYLAYVTFKEGPSKIFAIGVGDGSQRKLSDLPGIGPAYKPGSSLLAATLTKGGQQDIYLLSQSGEVMQKLVQGWSINVSPSWSPDGRHLAFVSNESGNPQIYVADVSTGQKRRVTFSGTYNTSPAWSPKGDFIAYSGMSGGRHNIFSIKPNGSENKQLTSGEGDNESPAWSPDGRMIAFSSTRQGGPAIWVLATNGTGIRRLTRQGGGQEMPDWSPRLR